MVHTARLSYTPSCLFMVYILNAQCEQNGGFYFLINARVYVNQLTLGLLFPVENKRTPIKRGVYFKRAV